MLELSFVNTLALRSFQSCQLMSMKNVSIPFFCCLAKLIGVDSICPRCWGCRLGSVVVGLWIEVLDYFHYLKKLKFMASHQTSLATGQCSRRCSIVLYTLKILEGQVAAIRSNCIKKKSRLKNIHSVTCRVGSWSGSYLSCTWTTG